MLTGFSNLSTAVKDDQREKQPLFNWDLFLYISKMKLTHNMERREGR